MQHLTICRCCFSQGCYKDISNEYYWAGQKEVYADLLLETFNIVISPQNGGGPSSGSRLICETCITRLRDAAAFKKQVLHAERVINGHLEDILKGMCRVDVERQAVITSLKTETEDFESYQNFRGDFPLSREDSPACVTPDNGEIEHLKVEYHSDLDLQDEMDEDAMDGQGDGEMFVIKLKKASKIDAKPVTKKRRAKVKSKKTKPLNQKRVEKTKVQKTKTPSKPRRTIKSSEKERQMKRNTIKLASNSNMCLFRSQKIKYQCFYCKQEYLDINELKTHADDTHTDANSKIQYLKRTSAYKLAEISNLKCSLCDQACSDIEDLQTHLVSHDIEFDSGGHLLVPFKMADGLKCVICQQEFNTFMRLLMHMNSHYTNHVCENCGASFISIVSLRLHVENMHRERKCRLCDITYITYNEGMKHMRKVHNKRCVRRRYCLVCNKIFKYTHELVEHRIAEHGAERKTASCNECQKTFISLNNLKIHIRSVHLRERNYSCTVCGLGFFTNTDRKRHERTHDSDISRLLSCSYCETKVKSKDSLRRHMNTQHAKLISY